MTNTSINVMLTLACLSVFELLGTYPRGLILNSSFYIKWELRLIRFRTCVYKSYCCDYQRYYIKQSVICDSSDTNRQVQNIFVIFFLSALWILWSAGCDMSISQPFLFCRSCKIYLDYLLAFLLLHFPLLQIIST